MNVKALKFYLIFIFFFFIKNISSEGNVTAICFRCECLSSNPFSVDCNSMNFKEMPKFKKDLKVPWMFRIQGNSLKEVPPFPILENLTEISFKYNQITTIADSAFANLTNLKKLDLSHNNLTSKSLNSDIFKGLFQGKLPDPLPLTELTLSFNSIHSLPNNLFKHLINLTILDISHNPFKDFSVSTAQSFSELPMLTKLDLSYTELQRLPNHFFAELRNLKELDLSGNDFIVVPPEVNYASSLQILRLNDNIFGIITSDAFWKSLSKLETLHLSESKTLFRVDNGAFANLTSLTALSLNNNPQLSAILPGAFTSGENRTLHLQELNLKKNHLESLPETALPWKEIPLLNLQENPWNCDCNFEWLAKDVIPAIESKDRELTVHVTCASPPSLMGERVTNTKVQEAKLICSNFNLRVGEYGFVVIATIVVGTLLLFTGTIIFSYVLFRRTKIQDWIGNNVKYRRTLNDDEEVITSNLQY